MGAIKTNADRIREMTDEELAEFLTNGTFLCVKKNILCIGFGNCARCYLAWLRSPVESEGEQ